MPAKKPALGRGLEALFASPALTIAPPVPAAAPTPTESVDLAKVPIEEIHPNPFQPRKGFDQQKLEELAASIRSKGILQPLILRHGPAGYQLIAGERRWRAAQIAGLETVPAILREFDDREMIEAALIENIQRDDLNPLDEAVAFRQLTQEYGLTQETLAEALGKSRVSITNALRLLKLPSQVQKMLRAGTLSAGHARALLGIESPAKQLSLAHQAVQRGLSVREVERIVRGLVEGSRRPAKAPMGALRDDVAEMQERLTLSLGLKVRLNPKTNTSGRIEIYYTSLDEFQKLCDQFGIAQDQPL